ncbi:FAD-dependent oxidoreductase [Planctomycetota bacterium]
MEKKDDSKVDVLVVGAGPAGLACAIQLKKARPEIRVCVVEKSGELGGHNLSGTVMEPGPLHRLLDEAVGDWRQTEQAKEILSRKVTKDQVMFLAGKKWSLGISFAVTLAKLFRLGFGQMKNRGYYIVSVSRLTKWLGDIAKQLGVEIATSFGVEDIIWDQAKCTAMGVKLADQGRDKEGKPQPNFISGEVIGADFVILAEGCDGLVTEKFAEKAQLQRQGNQLYSVGIKEIIKVSPQQYEKFGDGRVVHAMGYPLWTPVIGPNMFGGGVLYSYGENQIMAAIIVGADWKYCDFNPQQALTQFKEHRFVKPFIDGGEVVEAGAKMIPEGGYYAIPRDIQTDAIGNGNVLILGDSAGFVNMLKIKGLHNAIESGMLAGKVVAESLEQPVLAAVKYTRLLEASNIGKEMRSAKNSRQTIAKFGPELGLPLSALGPLLPKFNIEKDYDKTTSVRFKHAGGEEFDKAAFTALAHTQHREDQRCHLDILVPAICQNSCATKFGRPCVSFCPGGVYDVIEGQLRAANPSNCLHDKSCQRKCPFDNIRWTVPEGGSGPGYKQM